MTDTLSAIRIALVHYWLVTHRGGERVLEALAEMFPQADIFTLVYDESGTSATIRQHPIHTSFIQKLPFGRRCYRAYLPLFPLALEHFDLRGYDLVISSESGPAKGVLTDAETCHICYCHTPMRYVWNLYHDYRASAGPLTRLAMPLFMHYLRQWDQASASRVDYFVANSQNIARRVRKYFGREARVIYPPVDTHRFAPSSSVDSYYLAVAEMVPYKRIDLAVEAFNRLGRKLLVVGEGPQCRRWRRLAKANVEFLGRVENEDLARLYASCRALIFPGEEDFGIIPLEAQACGRPVIAYRRGGSLETVIGYSGDDSRNAETCTGLFFPSQTVDALIEAVKLFESVEGSFDPAVIRAHAERFDTSRFKAEMQAFVSEKLADFRRGAGLGSGSA
jgi:glycosyltransferase involved in cell wall biosynthesis